MIDGRRRGIAVLVAVVAVLFTRCALAAPDAELWERWLAHDPDSTETIGHGDWSALLGRFVVADGATGMNLFDYGAVGDSDRAALAAYLRRMASLPTARYDRDEQFAYWVNLYNALTVKVVLDHYPVDSIRDIDISPGLFSDGPWGRKLIVVEGEELSLDDIEHRILRPIWRDPRIHYAVNCASIGCPQLYQRAFTSDSVEDMLDRAARDYVNHPRGVRVEGAAGRLSVTASKIYDWYRADFGGSEAGVLAHLSAHAAPDLAERLDAVTRISRYVYDWSLNDVGRAVK